MDNNETRDKLREIMQTAGATPEPALSDEDLLMAELPAWSDPNVRNEQARETREYLAEQGWTDEQINTINAKDAIKARNDFVKYQRAKRLDAAVERAETRAQKEYGARPSDQAKVNAFMRELQRK